MKKFRVTNAKMGLRSRVPPMGGLIPRKRLRYGSQIVLHYSSVGIKSWWRNLEPGVPKDHMRRWRETRLCMHACVQHITHERGLDIASGTEGNHVSTSRSTRAELYRFRKFRVPVAMTCAKPACMK